MINELRGFVDICGVSFMVKVVDKESCPDMADCYGMCEVAAQTIYLSSEGTPDLRRFYLSHEMLHGIWDLAGLHDMVGSADKEEAFVRLVAPHIMRAEKSAERVYLG